MQSLGDHNSVTRLGIGLENGYSLGGFVGHSLYSGIGSLIPLLVINKYSIFGIYDFGKKIQYDIF